jgi:hypothetical protein
MKLAKFTVISNIFLSFKHGKEGYSARKGSAFGCFMVAFGMIIADKIPPEYRIQAFFALLACGLLCLGLVTIPQMIELMSFKKQKQDENNESK